MKHRYICIAAALLVFGVTGVWSSGVQTIVMTTGKSDCKVTNGHPSALLSEARTSGLLNSMSSDTTSILSTLHSETLQASKEARPQTLQECLEKGLNKNYSLRIVRNEEQMASNNATMENAGLLP